MSIDIRKVILGLCVDKPLFDSPNVHVAIPLRDPDMFTVKSTIATDVNIPQAVFELDPEEYCVSLGELNGVQKFKRVYKYLPKEEHAKKLHEKTQEFDRLHYRLKQIEKLLELPVEEKSSNKSLTERELLALQEQKYNIENTLYEMTKDPYVYTE